MKTVARPKNSNHKNQNKALPPTQTLSKQTVHFELVDPQAQKVCVAGTFNDWNPDTGEMKREQNGHWVKNLPLTPGTYEYRFVVDGAWKTDPNADHDVMNPYGERNSLLTVTASSA